MLNELKFGWSIFLKTTPFLMLRLTTYGVVAAGYLVYTGIILGFTYLFRESIMAWIIFLAGIGGAWGLFKLVQRYFLYMIKAGNVAVITELIHTGNIPEGKGQIEFGKDKVAKQFVNVNIMFMIDAFVDAIVRALNRIVFKVTSFIPMPGIEHVQKILQAIANFSVGYIDESILSYSFYQRNDNVWASAKDGVILYAQNWKSILKTSAVLAALSYGVALAFFIMLLPPTYGLAALMPGLKDFFLFGALITALFLRAVLVEALVMPTMISAYHHAIKGQVPNPEWDAKLTQVSNKFSEMKNKALNWNQEKTQAKAA